MNAARTICRLPVTLKSLCESGCIFRDATLRHTACATAQKIDCAAPCAPSEPCPCRPPSRKMDGAVGMPCYTYYHEVREVQEETERRNVHLHM
jgi:hypothetical protein